MTDKEKSLARCEYQKRYYERNKERLRAYQREYAKAHPQKKSADMTDDERNKLNAFRRLKYAANKEHFREYYRNYNSRNK